MNTTFKKTYISPTTETIAIETCVMLCGSTGTDISGEANVPALSRSWDPEWEDEEE